MGLCALDTLEQGMVLAADVYERSGRLLLGRGVELNAAHLRMFRMWGVVEVNIAGLDDASGTAVAVADVSAERLPEMEKELRDLFRNVDFSSPVVGELFRLCLLRKASHESR